MFERNPGTALFTVSGLQLPPTVRLVAVDKAGERNDAVVTAEDALHPGLKTVQFNYDIW